MFFHNPFHSVCRYRLVLADCNDEQGQAVARSINTDKQAKRAVFVHCDVTEDLQNAFKTAKEIFGPVTVMSTSPFIDHHILLSFLLHHGS